MFEVRGFMFECNLPTFFFGIVGSDESIGPSGGAASLLPLSVIIVPFIGERHLS